MKLAFSYGQYCARFDSFEDLVEILKKGDIRVRISEKEWKVTAKVSSDISFTAYTDFESYAEIALEGGAYLRIEKEGEGRYV